MVQKTIKTFHQDLSRGIKIEEKVLNLIRKKYPCSVIIEAYKGYDIWIPEIHKGIEVKYDPMSNKTGNIVIEIEMFNKPSALLSTTADIWIFHDDNKFVCIEPKRIIECILINNIPQKEFIGTGDINPKKAYLVKKELLFSYGSELK